MAGFTSQDDLINQISTNGKFWRADWNKQTATAGTVVVNTWSCLAGGAGNPPANTALGSGTTMVWKPMYDRSATGGGIWHGGDVGASATDYKCILNASAFSAAATTMPSVFMLVDLLAYATMANATINSTGTKTFAQFENVTFSNDAGNLLMTTTTDWDTFTAFQVTGAGTRPTGIANTTTYWTIRQSSTTSRIATSLTNAVAGSAIPYTDSGVAVNTFNFRWPRYTSGAGVQMTMAVSTAGSAGTTTFRPTYTNSAGTGSRQTPTSPALPLNNATAPLLQVPFSGTGSGKFGPQIPLQGADAGVQSIQDVILASSGVTAGVYNMIAYKPLITLPMTTIGVPAEREFISQLPSMPRVYDGACLVWLHYNGVATIPTNSNYNGHIEFGWS
jgi:hypothetical protein